MLSSAALRREIEEKLRTRIPGALSPRPAQAARLLSSGVPEIDHLLAGGVPWGAITEVTGPASSGRTGLVFSILAQAAREGACVYIDVEDRFDPKSAAASCVDLGRLLWVRFPARENRQKAPAGDVPVPPRTPEPPSAAIQQNGGGPHPRNESRGMDRALIDVFQGQVVSRRQRGVGTPSQPNRPLELKRRQEQVAPDRAPSRRRNSLAQGDQDALQRMGRKTATAAKDRSTPGSISFPAAKTGAERPWTRLDRALRATDLVLQAGGFRALVLDMGDVAPEHALRIPLATWYRFRRAAEEADAVFLLLTREPCAKSSAACVLACAPALGGVHAEGGQVLQGFTQVAEVLRQRHAEHAFAPGKKKAPGRAAQWTSEAPWACGGER